MSDQPKTALHRRVFRVGVVIVALMVGVGAIGLGELRSEHAQAATLAARGTARGLLGAAQLDVDQSQIQLELATSGQQTVGALATLPRALAQEQKGVDEWNQYKAWSAGGGRLPRVAPSLTPT